MKITLRPYQQAMVGQLYQSIRDGKTRVCLVALMGLGKTIVASWIMRDATARGRRCVFLVPLTVLLDQTADSLKALGVNCTVLQGDRTFDDTAPVIVASMQTIASRLGRGKTVLNMLGHQDLILADECHVTSFHNAYDSISATYPGAVQIGFTATPWRLSAWEWLGQKYNHVIVGPQPPEAVKLGAVVPCRAFSLGNVFDFKTLHVRRGDYMDAELTSQATRPEALAHIVAEWQRLAADRPTMMVGSTVRQAQMTAEVFQAAGISTAIIAGETSYRDRLAIFEQVKAGDVQMLCSVGCLAYGFNLPILSVVLYVRATKSRALFHQTAGRGSRPAPGKADFLLLDFGGNLKRFGSPMAAQDYSIDGTIPPDSDISTKTCPECGAEALVFAQVCPECGFDFGAGDDEGHQEELMLNHLTEFVDRDTRQKIANLRRWRRESWQALGRPDDAIERFVSTYGHAPPAEWLHHACLTQRSSQTRKLAFYNWLEASYQGRDHWAVQWLEYHWALEFGTTDLNATLGNDWQQTLDLPYTADWHTVIASYRAKIRDLDESQIAAAEALNQALTDARDELGQHTITQNTEQQAS
ncbi:MAG: DEAD/DEAH box helicase family protein [Nodosilinea sp.]